MSNVKSIDDSDYDPNKPTKIMIHGWRNSITSKFAKELRYAYLINYDYNIILVDWSKQAKIRYDKAKSLVPKIAEEVANLVNYLIEIKKANKAQIHIIGHSLGAHVGGIAGLQIRNGPIARVTGLDPAGPFYSKNDYLRLRDSSAAFVDVIHTCGKDLGFYDPLGQVDFYPNGGTAAQPGCSLFTLGICSHRRAYYYFAEAIKSDGFWGTECPSWELYEKNECSFNKQIEMGENTPTNARGNYYFRTNKLPPFARGKND